MRGEQKRRFMPGHDIPRLLKLGNIDIDNLNMAIAEDGRWKATSYGAPDSNTGLAPNIYARRLPPLYGFDPKVWKLQARERTTVV